MKHKSMRSVVNSVSFMCFTYGFNGGIIAGAILYIEIEFPILKDNAWLSGCVTASMLLSAFLANTFVGPLADRCGRVPILRLTNIPFVLGAAVSALAHDPYMLILGRTITGFAAGIAGTLPNCYIAEIVPSETRGKYVGMVPLFLAVGIGVSQLFALAVAGALGEEQCVSFGWRFMFGFGAVPAFIQALWMCGIPESPRWCYQKYYINQAVETSKAVAALEGGALIEAPAFGENLPRQRLSIKLAVIAGGLSAMQQLSGINAVVFYAPKIYHELGLDNKISILLGSLGSLVTVVMAFGVTRLVDSWGRRPLCKIGLFGMIGAHLLIGMTFHFEFEPWIAIVGILLYRALFSFSLGPLPYIMVSELFPQHQRAIGVSTSMMVNWFMNWIVVVTVPKIMKHISGYVFYGFAFVCAFSLFIVELWLPETANVQLDGEAEKDAEGDRVSVLPSFNASSFDAGALTPIAHSFDKLRGTTMSTLSSGSHMSVHSTEFVSKIATPSRARGATFESQPSA